MGKNKVKETADERSLAEVSIERWNDHQRRMVPLENKVIEDANRSTTAQDMKAAGQVNADAAQAEAAVPAINPNAGSARTTAPALQMAKQASQAQVNAGQNVQDQRASKLLNTVRMGEGKAANATAGFETAATQATSNAITNAVTAQQNRQATANAIGSAIGVGYAVMKQPKAAGALSDFTPGASQDAVRAGASSGQGGYTVKPNGAIFWNE